MATKITSRVIAPGAVTAEALAPGVGAGPVIANVQIANSSYVALDDTAVALEGGYILINGENFGQNVQVIIANTNATSVTYISSSLVRAQVPAKSAGSYIMYLVNTDTGATAIRVNALTYSGVPSWVTGSSLTEGAVDEAISIQLSANDATSYQLQAGSTLPTGLTLAANGLLSGTVTGLTEDTLYNFTIEAIDNENQDSPRAFSITITAGDQNINSVVLALKADSNTFITDTSTNSFTITPAGDTRPSAFSPYNTNWSNYFDGTGDSLQINSNNNIANFSGDFTVEFWFFVPSTINSYARIIEYGAYTVNNTWRINHDSTTMAFLFQIGSTSTRPQISSSTLVTNNWYHMAVVRNSGTIRMYVNGIVQAQTLNNSTTFSDNTLYIGQGDSNHFTGYISNVRIVKGTAVYTSNFTPATSPLTAISGTSLLTCQSNRLIDNSTNNFTITKNGDVKVTAFGPFTETDTVTGSGYFDGTGDSLSAGPSSEFTFGTGDFTIEYWVFMSPWVGLSTIFNIVNNSNADTPYGFFFRSTGTVGQWQIYIGDGSTWAVSGPTTSIGPGAGVWQHHAHVRSSGTYTVYINGVSRYSIANSTNLQYTYAHIGRYVYYAAGNISNFRIVKGTAVYTSNFTPPTSPLTAISNTSLLTLQNRISYNNSQPIDESGVKNIITRNGNASVGSYTPLSPAGWSGYFDGTGDYLTVADNAAFTFGSGNFTIELFLYRPIDVSGTQIVFQQSDNSTASGSSFGFYLSTNDLIFYTGVGSSFISVNGSGFTSSQWNHIAIVRNGNTFALFLNGTRADTNTLTGSLNDVGVPIAIGARQTGNDPFTGYLSNLRVVKGTSVYDPSQSTLTVPTAPLEPIANTSLLTLRSNSFVDEGPNRFAITRNGDTRITPFSPFKTHTIVPDSHSVYFDGTGDYLAVDQGSVTIEDWYSQDYTIELWVYPLVHAQSGTNAAGLYISHGVFNANDLYWSLGTSSTGHLKWYYFNGSAQALTAAANPLSLNTWSHVALVYTHLTGAIKGYVNGVEVFSGTKSGTPQSLNTRDINIAITQSTGYTGYLSNIRIVKGTAVYTANFTPPTSPLTTIANTSLLTCQSPTVIDNSNNAFAITVNGNAQPTKYNPFGETITTGVEYSLTNHGGSYYFDGTGDYLNTPATGQFAPAGVFTIECFVYITSLAAARAIIGNYTTNATTDWVIEVTTAGVLRAFTNGSTARISSASGAIQIGEWEHVVLTRNSSNVISLFLNGALIGTYSQSGVFGSATKAIYIGVQNVSTNPMLGYISNLRVVEGTALYTSAFVPPTAPPTPVRGTTLLLNGAGAAIADGVSKNVLETVGNARVINGVKKYGTGAMYFDGTGDYLNILSDPPLYLSTGNFTIEGWVYTTNSSTSQAVLFRRSAAAARGLVISINSFVSQKLSFACGNSDISAWEVQLDSTTSLANNTWYHFAVVRDGDDFELFINGTSEDTANSSVVIADDTSVLRIGANDTGATSLNGYIDDLRITKGVARYTSNFTPPTSFKLK
jgi:hypothetical protein